MPRTRRSQATADVRALLADLMSWHMNSIAAPTELRLLRERVVILTGREDLIEIPEGDISLRAKLIDAVQDYLEPPPFRT